MAEITGTVLSVGHSNLSYDSFLQLIRDAGVSAIADVRSAPYSRQNPHFNRETLYQELRADGISYVFMGDELGGRPRDRSFFCDGVADYEKMATTPEFNAGLSRVHEGSKRYNVALMCSEHSPLDCHRCLLVGRALAERGLGVGHILLNGRRKSQPEIETELLTLAKSQDDDLFASPDERLSSAYRQRAQRVAFSLPSPIPKLFAAE